VKLYRLIPHRWMTRACPGGARCTEPAGSGFHTHDTTAWFRLAYGSRRRRATS